MDRRRKHATKADYKAAQLISNRAARKRVSAREKAERWAKALAPPAAPWSKFTPRPKGTPLFWKVPPAFRHIAYQAYAEFAKRYPAPMKGNQIGLCVAWATMKALRRADPSLGHRIFQRGIQRRRIRKLAAQQEAESIRLALIREKNIGKAKSKIYPIA